MFRFKLMVHFDINIQVFFYFGGMGVKWPIFSLKIENFSLFICLSSKYCVKRQSHLYSLTYLFHKTYNTQNNMLNELQY